MANKKPIIKADANAKPGLTPEQKAEQVARFFTQKREQYFQIILGNLLRNEAVTHETMVTVSGKDGKEHRQANILEIVDNAIAGADYAIEKLFPLPTAEKKEDE